MAVVSGSGTTYDVAVRGMTNTGTVIASVPAGAAHSASGIPSQASSSIDNVVSYVPSGWQNGSGASPCPTKIR